MRNTIATLASLAVLGQAMPMHPLPITSEGALDARKFDITQLSRRDKQDIGANIRVGPCGIRIGGGLIYGLDINAGQYSLANPTV